MAVAGAGELTLAELLASATAVRCAVCKAVYSEPVLLPCLHSFCTDCLVELLLLQDGQTEAAAAHGTNQERGPLSSPRPPAPHAHNGPHNGHLEFVDGDRSSNEEGRDGGESPTDMLNKKLAGEKDTGQEGVNKDGHGNKHYHSNKEQGREKDTGQEGVNKDGHGNKHYHSNKEQGREKDTGQEGVNKDGHGNKHYHSEKEQGRDKASVRLILREIEGRRARPGERDPVVTSNHRPKPPPPPKKMAATAVTEAARSVSLENMREPSTAKGDGTDPPPAKHGLDTTSDAQIVNTANEKLIAANGAGPDVSTSEKTASRSLSLLLQSRRPQLSLVCPTCGHVLLLPGDVLVKDDEHAETSEEDDGETKQSQLQQNGESLLKQSSSEPQNGVLRGQSTRTRIPSLKATSSQKLRILVRKTIAASLPPNHFLISLAKIIRCKATPTPKTPEQSDNTQKKTDKANPTVTTDSGQREDLLCAYCRTEGQTVRASSLCLDCDDRMCETCARAHRKTRVTREHTVAPLSSIQQGLFDHDLRARDHVTCACSNGGPVSAFCDDCAVTVCKRCRADRHRSHQVRSLQAATERLGPELGQMQQAMARRVPALSDYANFLEGQISSLGHTRHRLARDICSQAHLLHKMVEDHKQRLLSRLERACAEQTSAISAKLRGTLRARDALGETQAFLLHLWRLGRADEILTSHGSVASFYRHLLTRPSELHTESSQTPGAAEQTTPDGHPLKTSDQGISPAPRADGRPIRPIRPGPLTTRLACVFTAGPCTDTNVGLLLGSLDLHTVPLHAKDSPQSLLPLTTLLPERLERPRVQLTFQAAAPGDTCPVYPSGIALHPRLLALADRENAVVKIFDRASGNFLRSFAGDGAAACSLSKPFDVIFLEETGTTLAVSDPEAGAVLVFESLTGKFLRRLAGAIRHPRGLALVPGTGEVVVLDGHLRHLTFHDPATGQMTRRIRPTLGAPLYDSSSNPTDEIQCQTQLSRENVNGRANVHREHPVSHPDVHHTKPGLSERPTRSSADADARFKSTALIDPYYVALTLSGDLAVTDLASPNLKIVAAAGGAILAQSMDYGTGGAESLHPSGLCVDRYGQMFISDTNNSRIHLALPNGQLTGTMLLGKESQSRNREIPPPRRPTKDENAVGTAKDENVVRTAKDENAVGTAKDENAVETVGAADESDHSHSAPTVSKPLSLAIDRQTGHLVVAQVGGEVKVIKYM